MGETSVGAGNSLCSDVFPNLNQRCVCVCCTCGECSRDYSAGVKSSGSLELDSVLCGLSQSLQPDPRVFCIQDQFLVHAFKTHTHTERREREKLDSFKYN